MGCAYNTHNYFCDLDCFQRQLDVRAYSGPPLVVVPIPVFFRRSLLPLVVVPVFFQSLGDLLLPGKWSLPFEAIFVEVFNDFLLLWCCCMIVLFFVIGFGWLLLLVLILWWSFTGKMGFCRQKPIRITGSYGLVIYMSHTDHWSIWFIHITDLYDP